MTPPKLLDDLPILKKTVDIYERWHGYFHALPRLSRYTLGTKIDDLFTDFIASLLAAGYATKENKSVIISRASVQLDSLKCFLHIAHNLKLLDTPKYLAVAAPLVDVGKQLGGWRKQSGQETPVKTGVSAS